MEAEMTRRLVSWKKYCHALQQEGERALENNGSFDLATTYGVKKLEHTPGDLVARFEHDGTAIITIKLTGIPTWRA